MGKGTLTDDERKALEAYLNELDKLTAQEPPHIEDTLTPEEYGRAEDFLLYGEGERPEAADRFTVTTVTDDDGTEHKAIIDTAWEAWNKQCADLTEKYNDVIIKALAIQLNKTDIAKSEQFGTVPLLRSLLEETPPPEDFLNLPTSQMTGLLLDVLTYGNELPKMPTRKKSVSHGTKNEVLQKGNIRRVTRTTKTSEISAEISDITKLIGDNDAAINLFILTLIEANKQSISPSGELKQEYVSFPLQELVDQGLYKTIRSARTGFNIGADALTSIKIRGKKTEKEGETITTTDALEVLFTGARIKNGQCFLFLNERVNWGTIAAFYTIIPRYYFTLPTRRAKNLLLYIFTLARQNTRAIEKGGCFNIGFRAIQSALNLPNEKGDPNPRRDTVEAIETAVERIENENHEYFHNADFQLQPVYDDGAPVSDCLDNGYLKVTLKGQYAQKFIEISKNTTRKTKKAERRREQIEDKAEAAALTKKLQNHK